jgi:hypothetical protein
MQSLLLSAVLVLSASPEPAAVAGQRELPDGTLIFLENCHSVVQFATKGDIAHVAPVFRDEGKCFVYEAAPGKIHRVPLDDYYAELARINQRRDDDNQVRIWLLKPQVAYTASETSAMRDFLDEQIGRRYSVKNYVRGKPYDGIHCAELTSNMLNRSGRYEFENCHKIHPQSLYGAVLASHAEPQELVFSPPEKEPWCARTQRRWSGWFTWCGWSCREAWLLLW